jgi:AraC-like DNA-binding protein
MLKARNTIIFQIKLILGLLVLNSLYISVGAHEDQQKNLFEGLERYENDIDWNNKGDVGQHALFNGKSSSIELNDVPIMRHFTFSAWIKPQELLKKNMAIVGVPGLFWLRTTNLRELQFTQPGILDNDTQSLLLSNDNWCFVSFVMDFPTVKIYLNGQVAGEFKWQGDNYPWNGQMLIGKDNWQEHFYGTMKDITIVNEVIDQQGIHQMYQDTKSFIHLSEGIVFYHPMDRGVEYYAGNNKGSLNNVSFEKDSTRGKVALFNGKDAFLNFGVVPVDNAVSISVWVKPEVYNRDHGAMVSFGHAYALRFTSGGHLLFTIPQIADLVANKEMLRLNEWQHVVLTFKEQEGVTFYLNGKHIEHHLIDKYKQVEKELKIGTNLWNDFYKGQMDDLVIWSRVLSEQEINELSGKSKEYWKEHVKLRSNKNTFYILAFLGILTLVVFWLLHRLHARKHPQCALQTENSFLKSIRDVVIRNMADSTFSVAEFALAMNMSKTKLYNTIKEEVGQAPKEFIRDIRLEEAARLLRETDHPINEIAIETGFESRAYFNKCFKNKYNDTPTSYRKSPR